MWDIDLPSRIMMQLYEKGEYELFTIEEGIYSYEEIQTLLYMFQDYMEEQERKYLKKLIDN